ncbi:MAG: ACT domain-containing protein [Planctomycetaceae bacterium]
MMNKEYIITMTAANRVGILSAVTKAMSELGADLKEASQTVVHGYFTMIFCADFPDTLETSVIVAHLQDVCRPFGIDVNLRDPVTEKPGSTASNGERFHTLRVGGDNRPGVLRELSSVISMRRIDIAGMHAVQTRKGEGFEMVMKISVPARFDLDGLMQDLNQVGRSFNITAELSDYS